MSSSPADSTDGDEPTLFVNTATSEAEAVLVAEVGVATEFMPLLFCFRPAVRTEAEARIAAVEPEVPTVRARPPVPANAVVTLATAREAAQTVGVVPSVTVTVSVEPVALERAMSLYLTVYLLVKPLRRSGLDSIVTRLLAMVIFSYVEG